MTGKPKPKMAADMGLSESTKNVKFLDHPSHEFIQSSFDSVFPRLKPSSKAKEAPVSDNDSTNVQRLAAQPEEATLDELDFGLGLDDSPPDSSATSNESPLEQGLDLGGADDMELALGDDTDFSSSSDAGGADELILGDDLDLGDDVMAKLAEIDQIMEADATNTIVRPSAQELGAELSLGEETDSENSFSIGDTTSDAQAIGLGEDDSLSFSDGADDEFSKNLTNDLGDYLGAGLQAGELDNDFGESGELSDADMFASPIESSAPKKKPLPIAPKMAEVSGIDDEDDQFSFTSSDDLSPDEHQVNTIKTREEPAQSRIEREVPPSQTVSTPVVSARSTSDERSAYKEVVGSYGHELERLQATLNHLRMDREGLVKKIADLQEEKIQANRSHLTLRAELDEKKIEIQIMKKRMNEETQDLKYQYELEQERRKLAEEKAKAFQQEALNMQQKVKLEIKKVSSRERELEQRLELLKVDAETQIRHRDMKILELKRKIDAMEFDIDTLTANEQRNIGDKGELEDKLDKAIKTLRAAIGILETDDPKLATLERLKKNLDV